MIDAGTRGPKVFILDTNVVLHDAGCLDHFEENDVSLPITVLEELDKFKKGKEELHFQAREFLRRIDSLTDDVLSEEGASLGPGRGRLRVEFGGEFRKKLSESLFFDSPDHRILDVSLSIQQRHPQQRVVLVTKDVNLRMKAKSLGLPAEDYHTDKVESYDKLYNGRRFIENVSSELVSQFYQDGGTLPEADVDCVDDPRPNENFVMRNGSTSVLATYHGHTKTFVRVEKETAFGIQPRNSEQAFALRALLDDDIKLVTLVGKAGSGKTLLALAAALESRRQYRQILLARPVVPLSNRDLGYLPGDVSAKLDPYMQPLFDNLAVIRHTLGERSEAQQLTEMLESHKLEITPLAYIRGRSLQRMFFIVDEAQNLTPHEIKTIVTRAGEDTKIVLTGDIHQIDHPYLDTLSNGLSYLINRMVGQPLYAHVTLEKGERSRLAELASDLL